MVNRIILPVGFSFDVNVIHHIMAVYVFSSVEVYGRESLTLFVVE